LPSGYFEYTVYTTGFQYYDSPQLNTPPQQLESSLGVGHESILREYLKDGVPFLRDLDGHEYRKSDIEDQIVVHPYGTDSFEFNVSDGYLIQKGIMSVSIGAPGQESSVFNDYYEAVAGQSLDVPSGVGVRSNDTVYNNDYHLVVDPGYGEPVHKDGSIIYRI